MKIDVEWQEELMSCLKLVAPGTLLRDGLENILRAKTGGMVIIGDTPEVKAIAEGGFIIDCPVTSTKLYELAKMDGAIILDKKAEYIWKANVQMQPESAITSEETGIRHRVSSRVARQAGVMVFAISQRRSIITLFKNDKKFVLSDISVLLAKSNQAIQTLERYCNELKKEFDNLSLLEFDDAVMVNDVLKVIQRSEMVRRIAQEIEFYLVQMGNEGRLIKMQVDELTSHVKDDSRFVMFDYLPNKDKKVIADIETHMAKLDDDEVLDKMSISKIVGFGTASGVLDSLITPRGYRILSHIPRLPFNIIDNIVVFFENNLQNIISASVADLDKVEGVGEVRSNAISRGISRIKEQAIMDTHY